MADFSVKILDHEVKKINENYSLTFEISGNNEYGLDKTIVNGIRRILLSSLPSVAFRTERDNSDLKVVKNTSSLHNEFLLHRISLIPLYIDPEVFKKGLLFHLNVQNESNILRPITSKDFDIHKIKPSILQECIKNDDFSVLDDISLENYDMSDLGKLSDEEKEKIFRPFKIRDFTEYCLITELNSNRSKNTIPELEIYGSPSVSYGTEKACWSPVSCSVYSFKEDEELFVKVAKEKLKINNIPSDKENIFVKELHQSEGERYFKRDKKFNPYWYNFRIDSQGYYPPHKTKNGDGLLVRACSELIRQFEGTKLEFKKLLDPESDSIMEIHKIHADNELLYRIIMTGGDDTIGSIIQSHIANHHIDDKSIFNLLGYKKVHPLEEKIQFTVSLNTANKIIKMDNIQKINSIIDLFVTSCDEISLIYQKIREESEKV